MASGVVLFAIGFVSFAAAVVYAMVGYRRTGEIFSGNKHVVFPWIILPFLVAATGGVVVALTK